MAAVLVGSSVRVPSAALLGHAPGVVERGAAAREERLKQWLRGMTKHRQLDFDTMGFGRGRNGFGMIASGAIDKGSVLAEVPLQAFLSEKTAERCLLVGPMLRKNDFRPWLTMCAHLLVERSRGKESFWHPYISALPSVEELSISHPLLWPAETIQELLQGSPMLDTIATRLKLCQEDHEALLTAGIEKFLPGGETLSEGDVRWASAVLLSRAFSLELDVDDDFDTLCLVPWADMLNHCSSAGEESCLIFDQDTKTASLEAHKSYSKGDEVFDSYGPALTGSQLFLDYGFVDDENENYAVDLPAQVLGPVRSSVNAALLEALGLPAGGTLVSIVPEGVDESVLAWTRAAIASPRELSAAGWKSDGKYQKAIMYFSEPINRDNECEVLRRLIAACENLWSKYPTSLEHDLDELTGGESDMRTTTWARKQAALRAIVCEKKALTAGKTVLCGFLEKLRAGAALKSLYEVDREEGTFEVRLFVATKDRSGTSGKNRDAAVHNYGDFGKRQALLIEAGRVEIRAQTTSMLLE
ncbi:hypothetical protein SELMODRAFT_414219 [Selaginella moellendorffii]|uniref:SET domain-containing protein n=2 Tax=Selaginella moellendorffii TaxID=88036 RepID=D8RS19_SELML|nr:hypothetical protein SELMODRAFT_414219 [Selaginella moellendorffii]